MVQFSHPYMTTGKNIALTIWVFVGKVMSLPFKMLSRLIIAFLPRSKRLFFFNCTLFYFTILYWFCHTTVTICSDFGAQENKVCHCFHYFPNCLPWSNGTGCHDLSFWMLNFKPAFSLPTPPIFSSIIFTFNAYVLLFCPHLYPYFILISRIKSLKGPPQLF